MVLYGYITHYSLLGSRSGQAWLGLGPRLGPGQAAEHQDIRKHIIWSYGWLLKL